LSLTSRYLLLTNSRSPLFVHWFIRWKHHEFSHVPISKDTCSFNISDNRTIHYINNDFTYLPLSPMKRNPTIIYSHSERDSMVNVNWLNEQVWLYYFPTRIIVYMYTFGIGSRLLREPVSRGTRVMRKVHKTHDTWCTLFTKILYMWPLFLCPEDDLLIQGWL
jgi:hypothetical protein